MNSSEKNGAFFLFKNSAVLLLSNRDFFEGYSLGAIGTSAIQYNISSTTIFGSQVVLRGIRTLKTSSLKYKSLQDIFKSKE